MRFASRPTEAIVLQRRRAAVRRVNPIVTIKPVVSVIAARPFSCRHAVKFSIALHLP
jgi:hypothetical protein